LVLGLSLEELSAAAGGVVTKKMLSRYEKGAGKPGEEVRERLAAVLGVKVAYLWSPPEISVRILAYRKRSRLSKREQVRIECVTQLKIEQRVYLQGLLSPLEDVAGPPVLKRAIVTQEAAEQAADEIRRSWGLGVEPIPNVTKLLEDHHIHVLGIDAVEKFDGVSAVAYDRDHRVVATAVAVQSAPPGERQRLSLMHEVAHILGCENEAVAFRMGAALLVPSAPLLQEVGAARTSIHPHELLQLKRRWGVSVQALLYRLKDLGVIREAYYRQWCHRISQLGWRKQEPLPLPPRTVPLAAPEGVSCAVPAGHHLGGSGGDRRREARPRPSPTIVRSPLIPIPASKPPATPRPCRP